MTKKGIDDDRPAPVSGETDTNSDIELPQEPLSMPGSGFNRYVSMVDARAPDVIDVDTISALLDSHAQLANVRLRILYPQGLTFFEAAPPDPRMGEEQEVPIRFPDHKGLVLRGATSKRCLELVAAAIERVIELRTKSGAQIEALDAEQKRLSLFFDFSEKVIKLAAFDDVITRFLRDVTRILEANEGTFFAFEKRTQELYIRCHHGSQPEVVEGFRLKVGEGIAGGVAADGRARIVNNVDECPDYVAKNNPIKNIISAPLTVRGKLVGVVNVNDRKGGKKPFSNRDLQLLVSLSRLGSIAIDNARLYEEVRLLLLSTIESITTAIDAKDQFALGHSRRVALLTKAIGERLELADEEIDLMRIAALLHDVGNLAISETVLRKPGPLTAGERALIKEHPSLGASILSPVKQLSAVLPGILDHHERYDGKGYPRRLKGDEISLQGRVIALADTFDAMTHDRPFRESCNANEALAEITSKAGTQFDPALAAVFVECYRDLALDQVSLDDLVPRPERELDF